MGGGKFTSHYEIFKLNPEDDIFRCPFCMTFSFYLFYEFCEDFKAIPPTYTTEIMDALSGVGDQFPIYSHIETENTNFAISSV